VRGGGGISICSWLHKDNERAVQAYLSQVCVVRGVFRCVCVCVCVCVWWV
jgi:hypothetical protein